MILMLSGYQGSGKSTVAQYLERDYGFKIVKMAEALKEMCKALLRAGCIPEEDILRYIEGTVQEKETPLEMLGGQSMRHVMRTLGSEWRDMIYVDLWSSIACTKIKMYQDQGFDVVCDDLRFETEIAKLNREFQGNSDHLLFTRIVNPALSEKQLKETHLSEKPLDDKYFNHTLMNDAGLDKLYGLCDRLMELYSVRRTGALAQAV